MRKINVLEFVSLDGVIQAPTGPEEDTSGGFAYGGWKNPHAAAVSGTAMRKQMNLPSDLLLGRKTFENFARFWLQHNDLWPGVCFALCHLPLVELQLGTEPTQYGGKDIGDAKALFFPCEGRC